MVYHERSRTPPRRSPAARRRFRRRLREAGMTILELVKPSGEGNIITRDMFLQRRFITKVVHCLSLASVASSDPELGTTCCEEFPESAAPAAPDNKRRRRDPTLRADAKEFVPHCLSGDPSKVEAGQCCSVDWNPMIFTLPEEDATAGTQDVLVASLLEETQWTASQIRAQQSATSQYGWDEHITDKNRQLEAATSRLHIELRE